MKRLTLVLCLFLAADASALDLIILSKCLDGCPNVASAKEVISTTSKVALVTRTFKGRSCFQQHPNGPMRADEAKLCARKQGLWKQDALIAVDPAPANGSLSYGFGRNKDTRYVSLRKGLTKKNKEFIRAALR